MKKIILLWLFIATTLQAQDFGHSNQRAKPVNIEADILTKQGALTFYDNKIYVGTGSSYSQIASADSSFTFSFILLISGTDTTRIEADSIYKNNNFIVDANGNIVTCGNYAATNKLTACATNAGAIDFSASSKTVTVADNITIGLDLNALEGLSSTGLISRTAANTYSERTITGTTAQISVSNGDGVSGNPTLNLPDTLNIDSGKLKYSPANDTLFVPNIKSDGNTFTGQVEYKAINVALDKPSSMSPDTLWFWQNWTKATVTIDSIYAESSTDDQDLELITRVKGGGAGTRIDSLTISTDGTDVYYISDTSIANGSIASNNVIGIEKPTITSNQVRVIIYYHYIKAW